MYSKLKFSNYEDKQVHNRYIRNTTCESMGHLNMSYPCRIYMSLHHELEFWAYYDRPVLYQVTKSGCLRQTSGIIISDSFHKWISSDFVPKKNMKKYKNY